MALVVQNPPEELILLFNKHVLSPYYVPDTLKDAEDTQRLRHTLCPNSEIKEHVAVCGSRSKAGIIHKRWCFTKVISRSLWETHFQPEVLLLYSLFHPDESWQFVVVIKMVLNACPVPDSELLHCPMMLNPHKIPLLFVLL